MRILLSGLAMCCYFNALDHTTVIYSRRSAVLESARCGHVSVCDDVVVLG
jgi:hypothetical protein